MSACIATNTTNTSTNMTCSSASSASAHQEISASEVETVDLHHAELVYGSWGVVYPSACAEYSAGDVINVDVSIVNEISIIDECLLEALEEFNDDCVYECEVAPQAVALPVVDNVSPIFAFAVPEGYDGCSEKLIKSEYIFDDMLKECLLDDSDFQTKLGFISYLTEDMTTQKLIEFLNQSNEEKKCIRTIACNRWREKREKKRQMMKEGIKPVNKTTARQAAAAKRVRENGKFKKLSTKWIPITDFRLTGNSV